MRGLVKKALMDAGNKESLCLWKLGLEQSQGIFPFRLLVTHRGTSKDSYVLAECLTYVQMKEGVDQDALHLQEGNPRPGAGREHGCQAEGEQVNHDNHRIPSRPALSVEEYQVGQLYAVAEASKNETGGGEGVEVLVNEPYEKDGEKGQYTHKIYHLQSKVPKAISLIAPKGALEVHEKAWNAYPYCRTVLTNEYMKDSFQIKIETWHKPDMGEEDNVHGLDAETLKNVHVVHIDIADRSKACAKDYKPDEDPAIFKSKKTGRGPLKSDWKKELPNNPSCPHMCAYKLVTAKFKWFGLQKKIESVIMKQEERLFTNFHRQLFCWLDQWVDLSMDDIRRMEEETKLKLDEIRAQGPVQGTDASED
ncbi:phosphatidylinositol transfer protein alpha isoform-like [Lampris incognitus]|uniref:phosphatidylinositol transfer protein alpha isoform-like n=1 Tax=Lampris incognitus TaxID=2546036 RepID=UPI0024B5B973|nr:phosphatidylinositol transfer protein alpha isoform-like [Lampris incognitus]